MNWRCAAVASSCLSVTELAPGAGQVAAGMLAPVTEAESEDPAFVDLAIESSGLYPEWIQAIETGAGLACGYREEGTLLRSPAPRPRRGAGEADRHTAEAGIKVAGGNARGSHR